MFDRSPTPRCSRFVCGLVRERGPASDPCGTLAGVLTRTYALGPAVGSGVGSPFEASVQVGEKTSCGVRRTVPNRGARARWRASRCVQWMWMARTRTNATLPLRRGQRQLQGFHPRLGRFGPPSSPAVTLDREPRRRPVPARYRHRHRSHGAIRPGPGVAVQAQIGRTTFVVEIEAANDSGSWRDRIRSA